MRKCAHPHCDRSLDGCAPQRRYCSERHQVSHWRIRKAEQEAERDEQPDPQG